ncbi:MAG: glycine betaine ABC transporter substrate-binding protein [Anaerolineaceae bacterium]|nr:glycine betaine ABC transporter substrate-binding protein [Anaerolineaceae bacterium]
MNKALHKRILVSLLLVLTFLISACSPSAAGTPTAPAVPVTGETPSVVASTGATIKIGSKDFTEEFIVAEMYAQLLENAGFKVERKLNLGGTPIAQTAITKGDIDLYPEYTSTGLLTVLKAKPLQDPQQIYQAVKSGYEQQFQLTWLQPSPFNDTQALAMTQAVADKNGIKTYTDLSTKASSLTLGGPAEFIEREDGLKALQAAYGGFQFKDVKQLGTGSLRYQALLDGQVDVVVAFGTDGQIQGNKLALLEDDKHVYPIYNIAPVVRMDTLQKNPQIADVLNKLAPQLTDQVMSGLNWQVDGPDKKEPAAVAKAFLQQAGLLK